jgi:hypothetical protein
MRQLQSQAEHDRDDWGAWLKWTPMAPIHVLRFGDRFRSSPVQVLQTLEETLGTGCHVRREGFLLSFISKRQFGREDAAFLALRPEDQGHVRRRWRGATTSIGKVDFRPAEHLFKDIQATDRHQRCLRRAR